MPFPLNPLIYALFGGSGDESSAQAGASAGDAMHGGTSAEDIEQDPSQDPWEALNTIWDKQQQAADIAWERSQTSAREAADRDALEAEKARNWQLFARRHYYQDMMDSLREAGLNPALAIYNSMGYSTPAASAAGSGYSAQAQKASVSTENVSMEMISLIVKSLADIASSALKLFK